MVIYHMAFPSQIHGVTKGANILAQMKLFQSKKAQTMFNQNFHAASPCYPCGSIFEPIGIGTTLRSKSSIRGCEMFGVYSITTRLNSETISIVDSRLRSHISGTG